MTAFDEAVEALRGEASFPGAELVLGGILEAFLALPTDLLIRVLVESGRLRFDHHDVLGSSLPSFLDPPSSGQRSTQ